MFLPFDRSCDKRDNVAKVICWFEALREEQLDPVNTTLRMKKAYGGYSTP